MFRIIYRCELGGKSESCQLPCPRQGLCDEDKRTEGINFKITNELRRARRPPIQASSAHREGNLRAVNLSDSLQITKQ